MPRDLLVVDDEPGVCRALKSFFESKGFRVATASSAQAAMDQIHKSPAEIVLLDLKLPDKSGLEVLSQIKEEAPGLRVVVISGLTDQKTVQEALERGASGYLTKPFDFSHCFYAAMGIETVDLSSTQPQPEALARVPVSIAQQYNLAPLSMKDNVIELAMADPLDVQHLDELKVVLGCEIKPVAIMRGDLGEVIRNWYGVGADVTGAPVQEKAPAFEKNVEEITGIIKLVNELIGHAHSGRATDLHVGIDSRGPWIRERIDGVLYDVPVAPQLKLFYNSIVSRFKVMASLDIAEHRLPQDGRIWFDVEQHKLDLRVSVLPTPYGENLAIRLLEPTRILELDKLGLSHEQKENIDAIIAKPSGLWLVTGPTGSGKSTTLYAILSKLNNGQTNIVTIEDPIEHEIQGITQLQVQPKIGLSFANGLRSMLRHDPNVIMVGEIRDQETANLAVRAALTGHLVMSTLHTNDAASGITRLLDLGIEPFVLCSTLSGIISQRLIRLLCHDCRESAALDAAQLASVGVSAPESGTTKLWKAKGCKVCHSSGYKGRTGVFEVLTVDHHIRSLVLKRTPSAQMRQSAMSKGMKTLWQSGWHKMNSGITSLDELVRILPPEMR